MHLIDISGNKYGRLTAVKIAFRKNGRPHWLFKCDCGKEKTVLAADVKKGATQSCGCLCVERSRSRFTKHGCTKYRNKTPEYDIWASIKQRCLNPNNTRFRRYGGRGITLYKSWYNFSNFLRDMGERPTVKHTIERIDNDKSYTPSNCTWATQREQSRNTSRTHLLTLKGKTLCLTDWATLWGVCRSTIRDWLSKDLTTDEMLYKVKKLKARRLCAKI